MSDSTNPTNLPNSGLPHGHTVREAPRTHPLDRPFYVDDPKGAPVGQFGTRAEAAAFLIDEGIKTQGPLFERVEQKLAEIERLRAELRGMVGEKKE